LLQLFGQAGHVAPPSTKSNRACSMAHGSVISPGGTMPGVTEC